MSPKNILVRMPNWLGDLVMATPILEDLHQAFPNARITALCTKGLSPLLHHHPFVTKVLPFEKPQGTLSKIFPFSLLRKIRKGHYDYSILCTNSFSSAFWFFLSRIKQRVGFASNGRNLFLTKAIPFPKNRAKQHLVLTYKHLLSSFTTQPSSSIPKIHLLPQEIEECKNYLESLGIPKEGPFLGINPGAAYGSAKCWLPERFIEVSQKLLEQDPSLKILYFGDQSSLALTEMICKELPPTSVWNLAGKTSIRQLAACLSLCKAFLTNDSGPMHLADALQIPLVALFGSTSDVTTGPYLSKKTLHKNVSCSPCYLRTCPIDFRCMKAISTQEVFEELTRLL